LLRLLAFKPQPIDAANNATTAQKKTLTTAPIPRTDPAQGHPAPQAVTAAPKAEPIVVTDAAETLAEPAQTPSTTPLRVQTLPVRQATEPTEKLAPKTLVLTEEGHFWTETVRRLISAEAISALVRELALQSQLIARDTDQWHLRIESESLNQGVARERLQAALHAAGHSVKLVVEIGKVSDSPAQRNAAALAEKQKAAEDLIHADPLVQAMVQDFGAKIVPGSIRLIS
jgi:DNA polymerase III subunit gamma/tau